MRCTRLTGLMITLAIGSAVPVGAQVTQADSIVSMLSAAKRSGVTRAELEASLVEIDKILASGGYSGRSRDIKAGRGAPHPPPSRRGDIRPGDQIAVAVATMRR